MYTTAISFIKNKEFLLLYNKLYNKLFKRKIKNLNYLRSIFKGLSGIEIGGPSRLFSERGFTPLYAVFESLDGCNYSSQTIWEGNLTTKHGAYHYHENKTGKQYILEATDLHLIPNESYDFVISSNCLEHSANPLKAIEEWLRILKQDGLLLIAVPNKKYCFDHMRPNTQFAHLLEDYHNQTGEDDLSHLEEILQYHDLKRDPQAGSFEKFKLRSNKNQENRALHHHVFNMALLHEIFHYFNLGILVSSSGEDLVIIGQKALFEKTPNFHQ